MTNPHRSGRATARRKDEQRRAMALAGVAAVAAAGFAALTAAVARRATAKADRKALRRTAAARPNGARKVADAISPAGKWWTYIPAGLAASAYVLRADGGGDGKEAEVSRRAGAGAITLAAVVATGLNHAFDRLLPQPPPPPGRKQRTKPVFPSGHAFGPTAVGLATAYVLAREELASPAVSVPAALAISAVTAGARLLEEKHWASDVLGGFVGGVALAAGCAAAYEAARARGEDGQGS